MIYIGHLDLLKLFQRAIKRAGLPISYSAGFNPHQLVSFALPLPIGYSSLTEYADLEFTRPPEDIVTPLASQMPDGIRILSEWALSPNEHTAASLVSAAVYEINFPDPLPPTATNIPDEIIINKKSKSGSAMTDIRPDIISLSFLDEHRLIAVLSAGSNRNLKPASLVEYIYSTSQTSYDPFAVKYKRLDLLTHGPDEYISLKGSSASVLTRPSENSHTKDGAYETNSN